jgi:uncharacterized protein (DUF2147 family)
MKRLLATIALLPGLVMAQSTPVGVWKTIDDDGKTAKSIVRVTETGGVLSAVIEKVLDPKAVNNRCDLCKDDRKDKPIVGLEILRGVKADGDGLWAGGEILDPKDGKTYKVRLKPIEGGARLEVRGYIGAPLFGRTQVWQRTE